MRAIKRDWYGVVYVFGFKLPFVSLKKHLAAMTEIDDLKEQRIKSMALRVCPVEMSNLREKNKELRNAQRA